MTVNGNSVNIAAMGPGGSLRFYWAPNGTHAWHAEHVAGGGTTFSAPSMVTNGSFVNIAAVGKKNALRFYWAQNGVPGLACRAGQPCRQRLLGPVDGR